MRIKINKKRVRLSGIATVFHAADLEYHQGGIQLRFAGYHDFYIRTDRNTNSMVHLLGIDSPGLTAAPAIAKCVANMSLRYKKFGSEIGRTALLCRP